MNQQINEFNTLVKIAEEADGDRYRVVSSINGIVQYEFKASIDDDDPVIIALNLLADDWFVVENDNEKECSLNYSFDENGKFYIIESHGQWSDTRSVEIANHLFMQLNSDTSIIK
ncbi:hypothetical protein [Paenibacillus periandrae]|uniref:hypothetical protein n=1 Tax=Paenibacillus periandrae TaxID=1761741 RepID=UPI001F093939|nr:hypothetical protein [Paenibacillus periandrae]